MVVFDDCCLHRERMASKGDRKPSLLLSSFSLSLQVADNPFISGKAVVVCRGRHSLPSKDGKEGGGEEGVATNPLCFSRSSE